jgi:nitroreductase
MTTRPPLPAPAQDLIGRRYSCRTYLDSPISADDQTRLLDFMATRTTGPFGAHARFGLLAAAPGDRQALRRLGTYGFIKGATGFIVGAVRRAPHDLEDYGYLLEEIVLFATGIGLGTCWLGGTFTRSTFVRRFGGLGRDETMPAVIALGYAGDDGRVRIREREEGDRRLPAGELFFDGRYGQPLPAASAGRYAAALEAVRMAPSATNKQPWRIVRGGGEGHGGGALREDGGDAADGDVPAAWHFLLQRTKRYGGVAFKLARIADLQRVDLGIAMCHFALVARESGLDGCWVVDDPGLDLPAGVAYTATWRASG